MLGIYLHRYLGGILLSRKEIDANKIMTIDLIEILEKNSFPMECNVIIINCMAVLKGTYIQQFRVNSIFPHLLSVACKVLNFKLIHISTNDVFNRKSVYSLTKAMGEPEEATVIRTSIIGKTGGLMKWIIDQSGNVLGYDNHLWNGITCLELAKILRSVKANNTLIQIISPQVISKYELLNLIKKYYNLPINIIKHTTERSEDKTLSSGLISSSIEDQLKELIEFDSM